MTKKWKFKNLYLIYIIGFLDFFAVSMFVPLLMSYCKSLGASPSYTVFITLTYGFMQFFSCPIVGRYSDIVGRKLGLQVSSFVSFFTYFVIFSTNQLSALLFSRVFLGVFKHTQDLCKAYIADNFTSKQRTTILGNFNSIANMAFIFGPLFASYVLTFYESELNGHGIDRLASIISTIYLINFILSIVLDDMQCTKQYQIKPSKLTYLQTFESYLKVVCSKYLGFFWFVLSLRFLLSYSVFSSRYDLSLYLKPKELSMVTAVGGLSSTLSGFFVGFISNVYNHQHIKVVLHASILQGLSIVGLTYSSNVYSTIFFTIPMSFVNAILKVTLTNLTLNSLSHRSTGLVMGIATSTISLSRTVAPLFASLLEGISTKAPGIVGFVASFSASIVLLIECNGKKK